MISAKCPSMRHAAKMLAAAMLCAIMACALSLPASAHAAPAEGGSGSAQVQTSVDPSSVAGWESVVSDTTENIGRIWTDKSVFASDTVTLPGGTQPSVSKGSSDFLVALSALSSTSNITSTQAKPLDIVLVLDTSGSMANGMGKTSYAEVYDLDTDATYAVSVNGRYRSVEYSSRMGEWYYGSFPNRVYVTPKASADDTAADHVQFYREIDTKMEALQYAAANFVRATAENNAGLSSAEASRISLVTYASSATLRTSFTAYTPETASSLIAVIEGLRANGATAADYAMQTAQAELAHARGDAQKVVVFFTDGEPNHQNGFDGTVANAAISASKGMKDDGTLVYTVGVFEDADPSDESTDYANRFNAYMHGMSSNYPQAESYTQLGERTAGKAYYKAASDADELDTIFSEISEEIAAGSGFPTTVIEGAENTSGYIVFSDQLGSFMHVDEFKDIVFADENFPVKRSTVEGTLTTYYYEGVAGNDLYPQGNLSDIIVRVERFADASKGDLVTVMIPASLIPLRYFSIDADTMEMSIKETFPLRVFYGASLDPAVLTALSTGEVPDELKAYIAENAHDGSVSFLSNYFDGLYEIPGTGQVLGNTTSSFRPAEGNAFYYYTKDTPLFVDEQCSVPVNEGMTPVPGELYYYRATYYELVDGTAVERSKTVPIHQGDLIRLDTAVGYDEAGHAHIKAGSPRLTSVYETSAAKTDNATSTATEVINPQWDSEETPDILHVYLGNNGKIDVALPGTLAVTKNAQVAPGKNLDASAVVPNAQFTFSVSIPSAANQTLSAKVVDDGGDAVAGPFEIAFDENGVAEHSIKDGETLLVSGIAAGAAYEVSESRMPAGFSLASVNGVAGAQKAAGSIEAGRTETAVFADVYDVSPTTVRGDDFACYAKSFDAWDLVSQFALVLEADDAGEQSSYPLPAGAQAGAVSVWATQAQPAGNFGDVTFDKPGTYTYTVYENAPAQAFPGVTYSAAIYTVTAVATDNGEGGLDVRVSMAQASDDDGAQIDPEDPVQDKTARFANEFGAHSTKSGPEAVKLYVDGGGVPLADGMFTFKVRAIGDNAARAPLPATPDADGYIYVGNRGQVVMFGQATFDETHVGETFAYELSELIDDRAVNAALPGVTYGSATPDQRALAGWTYAGVTYDSSVYFASFAVTSRLDVANEAVVAVAVSYADADGAPLASETPVFRNAYDPEDAVLAGDTAIKGRKTLTGRDCAPGETFSFELTAADEDTRAALAADTVVFADDPSASALRVEGVGDLENGVAKEFSFGKASFARIGTYRFSAVEIVPAADGDGMTYDRRTVPVTVQVADADGDGALEADVTYGAGAGGVTSAASFANAYRAQGSFGATTSLTVTKTLAGRAMNPREFSFSVAGADAPGSVSAAESQALLTTSDQSFSNANGAASGVPSVMNVGLSGLTFTQDQVGKTYSYAVFEQIPTDDDPLAPGPQKAGVTYDETVYRLDISVMDTARGAIYTKTSLTRIADGQSELMGVYDGSTGHQTVTVAFQNSYAAQPATVDTTAAAQLVKVLGGRDWTAADSFAFSLSAVSPERAPLPALTNVTVSAPDAVSGEEVPFGFGQIVFDAPGTYVYKVVEDKAGAVEAGIRYSSNEALITVTVTDPGTGRLQASASAVSTSFENVYSATLDHDDAGGLVVTKVLRGRAMTAGQFLFQIEAVASSTVDAAQAAARIGLPAGSTSATFGNFAGDDGQVVEMPSTNPIRFTLADVGKTYAYRFSEQGADATFGGGGTAGGYTYSDAVYTVELTVRDAGDGTLVLDTKVENRAGEVTEQTSSEAQPQTTYLAFENAYEASTDVPGGARAPIATQKTLTGRPLDAGEFSFSLVAKVPSDRPVPAAVATAVNDAEGTVDFGTLGYTTADLALAEAAGYATKEVDLSSGRAVWTLSYTAVENTDGLADAGVTPVRSSFDLTVTVEDRGDGTLAAEAHLPSGHGFENSYATAGSASKALSGSKRLVFADGLSPDDIAGKFTFTVTGEPGAPMPQRTTATNDGQGNVDFGAITFTLDDLNAKLAADGAVRDALSGEISPAARTPRSATFAYVIEESGEVAGVTNDATPKTVTFTVTDDGAGNLTVASDPQQGPLFAFENVYGVQSLPSSITDQISVTKVLDGRDLRAGEFAFELVENGAVVARGTNDANGTVLFDPVTYTRPAEHRYSVREVSGGADSGVTFDDRSYAVLTKVADAGDGTLSVSHRVLVDADGGDAVSGGDAQADRIVFENAYEPAAARVVIGVSKVLVGADLAAGQFAFELIDADGDVIATAKNDENGTVAFAPIAYAPSAMQGASTDPRTGLPTKVFAYTVAEIDDGQEGVVYDDARRAVNVTVVDDLQGRLVVTDVSFAEGQVFENVYQAPSVPEVDPPVKPEPGIPVKTGDAGAVTAIALAGVALAAFGVATASAKRRRS